MTDQPQTENPDPRTQTEKENLMVATYVWIQSLALSVTARLQRRRLDQGGQASAEYALVMLGAAAVALLVMAWATRTNRIGRLLDAVMDQLLNRVR